MSWGDPWALLALLLPVAAGWVARRTQRDSQPPWPAVQRVSITKSNGVYLSRPGRIAPAYLIMAALALASIALARPQWGEQAERSFSQSREVMIALDLSRSMWAEDMPGPASRLQSAKALIAALLGNLRGENVGLVVFAGTSFVQVPMSPDYQIIREFLPSLEPGYMPRGGSDYGRMLESALEGFSATNDRDRYLLVLSDGESTTSGWEKEIPDLLRHDIHVVGIGFGTQGGTFIPDQKGGRVVDKDRQSVISHLIPATLQTLADRTEGTYVAATTLSAGAAVRRLIRDTVESGRAGRSSKADFEVGIDRFQWVLAPAVLLGLMSLAREFRRHPRPRQVRPPTAVALALLACVLATPHANAYHNSDAKDTLSGDPAKRVRAMATRMGRLGYDAVDLRLLVEASIEYGAAERSRARMPLQGVMHDAIDAAHVGRKLAPQLAPWDRYESRIDALLAPLPTQAQETEPQKRSDDDDDDDPDEKSNRRVPLRKAKDKNGKDLYGKNSRARSEFALGDLSADENFMPQESHGPRHRPPRPPQKAVEPQDTHSVDDPILVAARKNMAAVVKADSPGRVHQLLAGEARQGTVERDW